MREVEAELVGGEGDVVYEDAVGANGGEGVEVVDADC